MSSAAARKSLGTNVHFTEKLEDGSIFVSRVPKTLPEISEADLPPALHEYKPVERRPLTAELKHAMTKLRNEDPAHWTVSKLAKKFDVPPQVVLMLAPCPKWRREEMQRQADQEWEALGYKKRLIRINRLRRRLLW
ncbi:hypothetical protein LPJ64_001423 [Coemansia asiatica]|uniref:Uncharacterized protein n=1 Tax=Coemansia asiatica TaxID=1052880 RepID=A0A9W8CK00_9FUNG|nr:hypothetical protein LPJ64_001423 [Coemansia asiatica]